MKNKRCIKGLSLIMAFAMCLTMLMSVGITVAAQTEATANTSEQTEVLSQQTHQKQTDESTQEPQEKQINEVSQIQERQKEETIQIQKGEDKKDLLGATVSSVALTIPEDLFLVNREYTTATHGISAISGLPANCTVEKIRWQDPGGVYLNEGDRFERDYEYTLGILLKLSGSDIFDNNPTATINGGWADVVGMYLDSNDNYTEIELSYRFMPIVNGTLNELYLTGVPELQYGSNPTDYSFNDTGYNATGKWQVYKASTKSYENMSASDTFDTAKTYRFVISITANIGYAIENEYQLFIDGNDIYNSDYESNGTISCIIDYPGGTVIDIVEIDEDKIPKAVEGQSFSNKVISIPVPAGSNYTVSGYWKDEEGNKSGTFTKGKVYYFVYTVYANEGYSFIDSVTVQSGDKMSLLNANGATATGEYRNSFLTVIDKVVLDNVPVAELGKTIQVGEFDLQVPSGAKYTAEAIWRDENDMPVTSDKVEKGKKYKLEFFVNPKEGYEFAYETILMINGVEHRQEYNIESIYFSREYSFKEKISHVELLGLTEQPAIGKAPAPTDAIKSSEPDKYEVLTAQWIDVTYGGVVTAFEKGRAYDLRITLVPKEGYEFITPLPYKIGNITGKTYYAEDKMAYVTLEYSFEEVIPEIRIESYPTMKVGETAKNNVKLPAGANYDVVEGYWNVWNEEKSRYQKFEGVFEAGKSYYFNIVVRPKIGYRFDDETTKWYQDGKQNGNAIINNDIASIRIKGQSNAKLINRVELTLEKPQPGTHSSVPPTITLPSGANYRIDYSNTRWTFEGGYPLNDRYFEEGIDYGLSVALFSEAGYEFSEDLVVVVNGVELPKSAVNMIFKHAYVDFNLSMVPDEPIINEGAYGGQAGDESVTSPKTGDSFTLWILLSVMAVSGAATVGIAIFNKKHS